MKAPPWTAADWSAIMYYAKAARASQPRLSVKRHAGRRLREYALQSEILSQRAHDVEAPKAAS